MKLETEAISQVEDKYIHIKKYVNDKGEQYLESEDITLERYIELNAMFGGNVYSHETQRTI